MINAMILSTNQPYFSPFPGFFYKAYLSDIFVILDQVQFPLGTTWLSRNRYKNDQGTLWMTVPVWKKGLGLQRIDEVKICHEGRWAKKHQESLKGSMGQETSGEPEECLWESPILQGSLGICRRDVFTER
jgi:hypothetical protein